MNTDSNAHGHDPQWEMKSPPPPRNGHRVGIPNMKEFVEFLDANEGIWAVFHTYSQKQSGYQRASDAQKRYGTDYEFVARHEESGTTVYGRKKLSF
jgi:hypothetical protein